MFSRMTGKRYEGIFMAGARCVKNWFELEPVPPIAVSKSEWGLWCMKARIWISFIAVLVPGATTGLGVQTFAERPPSAAQMELRMEVATTNEDGSPQALRFTLTNDGNTPVVLPIPTIDCITGNGRIYLHSKIASGNPNGGGFGHGCLSGGGHVGEKIVERVKKEWIELQPGEFLVFTGDGRTMLDKSDGLITYEYWAEYEPPKLSETESRQLQEAGYVVPADNVTSEHLTYSERWPLEE